MKETAAKVHPFHGKGGATRGLGRPKETEKFERPMSLWKKSLSDAHTNLTNLRDIREKRNTMIDRNPPHNQLLFVNELQSHSRLLSRKLLPQLPSSSHNLWSNLNKSKSSDAEK